MLKFEEAILLCVCWPGPLTRHRPLDATDSGRPLVAAASAWRRSNRLCLRRLLLVRLQPPSTKYHNQWVLNVLTQHLRTKIRLKPVAAQLQLVPCDFLTLDGFEICFISV